MHGCVDRAKLFDFLAVEAVELELLQVRSTSRPEFGGMDKSRESMAWRCDMHPAWDRSFRWLAFNGRPDGERRQVLVSFMGDPEGLASLFKA